MRKLKRGEKENGKGGDKKRREKEEKGGEPLFPKFTFLVTLLHISVRCKLCVEKASLRTKRLLKLTKVSVGLYMTDQNRFLNHGNTCCRGHMPKLNGVGRNKRIFCVSGLRGGEVQLHIFDRRERLLYGRCSAFQFHLFRCLDHLAQKKIRCVFVSRKTNFRLTKTHLIFFCAR